MVEYILSKGICQVQNEKSFSVSDAMTFMTMQSWHHDINFVDKLGNRSYIDAPKGPLAQLGERVNGIHEVSGSIPLRST